MSVERYTKLLDGGSDRPIGPVIGKLTAVSESYFVRPGSRSMKPSSTIHLMRRITSTDKRETHRGQAYCGVDVSSMSFSFETDARLDERTCKRCKRGYVNA